MQEAELRRAVATKFSSQLRNLLTAFLDIFAFFLFLLLFSKLKDRSTGKIGHKTPNSPSIIAAANLDEESVKNF